MLTDVPTNPPGFHWFLSFGFGLFGFGSEIGLSLLFARSCFVVPPGQAGNGNKATNVTFYTRLLWLCGFCVHVPSLDNELPRKFDYYTQSVALC